MGEEAKAKLSCIVVCTVVVVGNRDEVADWDTSLENDLLLSDFCDIFFVDFDAIHDMKE